MAIASIARRVLGGGRRRPAPRPGPTAGPKKGPGGPAGSSTDAQVGRAARKGLRRLLR